MSIDRIESILILVPSNVRDRFIGWLYKERRIHIEEFTETNDAWSTRFNPIEEDTTASDNTISKLAGAVDFLREIHKTPGDFLESLFPVKMLASAREIREAAESVEPETLASTCRELQVELETTRERLSHLIAERDRLYEIAYLTADIERLRNIRHLAFRLVAVSGQAQKFFLNDSRLTEHVIHAVSIAERNNTTVYILVSPRSLSEYMQELIIDYSLREIALPDVKGTIANALVEYDTNIRETKETEREVLKKAEGFSKQWAYKAQLALAHWESERNRIIMQQRMMASNNIFSVRGYIRSRQLDDFRARLEREFPAAETVTMPLGEKEEPPVSVTWNSFFRPAGLLVKMFGLPSYRGIDPTTFLTLTFLTFFGICYGDVLYGIMLIFLASYLKKRFREQKGLVQFFRLFSYAGVSTILFGVLVGSWGADLPMYFGKGNIIDSIRMKLTLLDPLTKPVVALAIAVGIGVTNQLYGIFMRFLRDFRRGDVSSAIYDGAFWFLYLTSLLTLAVSLIVKGPALVTIPALVVFIISAAGLVLTQGRDQKGFVPRMITGVVSLYGIMGTYGTTAFMGDVISYSRLMALGMTTSVVGMSFNIIAGMLKEIPYAGWFLFTLVVIFGHIFNFVMSILSAFVHSARLILLEWFGRFYEGGGKPFMPFGFSSSRLELIEEQ